MAKNYGSVQKSLLYDHESAEKITHTLTWTKTKCYKNLAAVSLAFLFIFNAFMSLQSLESSLHPQNGLGLQAVGCVYAATIASSVLSPLVIQILGVRNTMLAGFCGHAIFVLANLFPAPKVLLPGSIAVGCTVGCMLTAQGKYVTTLAIIYARVTKQDKAPVISRFHGIFFFVFVSSFVWGNLIASLLLYISNDVPHVRTLGGIHDASVSELIFNASDMYSSAANDVSLRGKLGNVSLPVCGPKFCHPPVNQTGAPPLPTKGTVNMLLYIFLGLVCLGGLILLAVVDKLPSLSSFSDNGDSSSEVVDVVEEKDIEVSQTAVNILGSFKVWGSKRVLVSIPLFIYTGAQQAIIPGDFSQAYVTCEVGIHYVGFTMVAFGAVDVLAALLNGQVQKYTGRQPLFFFSLLTNVGLVIWMMLYPGSPRHLSFTHFLIPALWGATDAIWQTQTSALVGTLFPEQQESVFGAWRAWQAAGAATYFFLAPRLCIMWKLRGILGLLALSTVSYIALEMMSRKDRVSEEDHKKEREKKEGDENKEIVRIRSSSRVRCSGTA